jgi:hypothetical protein
MAIETRRRGSTSDSLPSDWYSWRLSRPPSSFLDLTRMEEFVRK